ncbi:MAG: hypothetical protein NT094_01875, partial [Candidatus Staskawiczbacteria bacterium]|nr:hypothetical protein [Candidatus Staskawiczbacteria bacterium]
MRTQLFWLIVKWTTLSAMVVEGFWMLYWIWTGTMPFTSDCEIGLPEVPRIWDFAICPIIMGIIFCSLTSERVMHSMSAIAAISFALIVGIVATMIAGPFFGITEILFATAFVTIGVTMTLINDFAYKFGNVPEIVTATLEIAVAFVFGSLCLWQWQTMTSTNIVIIIGA